MLTKNKLTTMLKVTLATVHAKVFKTYKCTVCKQHVTHKNNNTFFSSEKVCKQCFDNSMENF